MADNVRRARLGRQSAATASARRERAANAPLPRRGRRNGGDVGSSQQPHPQPEPEYEPRYVDEVQAEYDRDEESDEEPNDEHVPVPPPSPPQPVKIQRARNPPPEEPVNGGFPGGPSDLSVIPLYGQHVAASLWKGDYEHRLLRCINHGNKINDLDKPTARWFWKVVEASGLHPLLKTNYNQVDHGLLTAFTERWHKETGTFHLPIGEMTITLDDVSSLLHIPIQGKMLNHMASSIGQEEGMDMCAEFLNFPNGLCHVEFKKMKGAHISFPKLQQLFNENLNLALEAETNGEHPNTVQWYRDCTIRAFLLYLVGGTIFTNKSAQYVDVVFLPYFQDLDTVNQWNWGTSALAYLYNYLNAATEPKTGHLAGYTCLFQAWIMVHFNKISPRQIEDNYDHSEPLASMFYAGKGHKSPCNYRTFLDRMEVDEVEFNPYEEHRAARPFEDISWYSGWIMCGRTIICPHLPERVLRQYGHVQSIPRDPALSASPLLKSFQIERHFRDYTVRNYVTEEMRGPRVQKGWETVPGYLVWFYRVSHPMIWAPVDGNPPRPVNHEVLIAEENSQDVPDPLEICRRVRGNLKEVIDSDPDLEQAIAGMQRAYIDLEPATTYQVRRKRMKEKQ